MKRGLILLKCLFLSAFLSAAEDSLRVFQLDTAAVEGMGNPVPEAISTPLTAGEAIRFAPGVFLRATAAGGMQLLSAQGLNPQHLQILWNGIPVSSGMLGVNDLSLFSVGYRQQVRYHGQKAELATGGIAGVLDIASAEMAEDNRWSIRQSAGSFGQMETRLEHSGGHGRHRWNIHGGMERAENDFRFNDYTVLPNVERRQQHGAFKRFNVYPSWYWQLKDGLSLEVMNESVWNERHIPPSLVSPMFRALQKDLGFRNLLRIKKHTDKGKHEWSAAYVYHFWYYNDIILQREDENREQMFFTRYQGDRKLAEEWKLFFGADLKYTRVSTPSYHEQVSEWGFDAHTGIHWSPREFIKGTVISKLSTRSQLPVYAPLSMEWQVWPGQKRIWKLWLRAGTDARYPTLNDRFWQPGGNPDLLAERSRGGALGVEGRLWGKGQLEWRQSTEAFITRLDDMILWQPTNKFYWVPMNIGSVRAFGFSLQQSLQYSWREYSAEWTISYAYNRSGSVKQLFEHDKTVGKQLPYFPRHSLKTQMTHRWKGWSLGGDMQVYSERFVTRDEGQSIPAYSLVNLFAGYRHSIAGKWLLESRLGVNNLLNQYYEELVYRPMPLRNYLFTIIITKQNEKN